MTERKEKYAPILPLNSQLPPLLYPYPTPFLFSLRLSFTFLEKICVEFGKTHGKEAEGGGGRLKGNNIKPTHSSRFPFNLLSLRLPGLLP